MAYTSLNVQEALQELAHAEGSASLTIVTLGALAKLKGVEHKAFAASVADIVNAKSGKPMSTKLPYSIGAKLSAHMPKGIGEMDFDDAVSAAADYVIAHKDAAAAIGATKWDAWNKVAHLPAHDAAAAAIVDAHNGALADKKAQAEANAEERDALIAAGKAAVTSLQNPPPAADGKKVSREALLAGALALIAEATDGELDTLGELIQLRRDELVTARRKAA